MIGETFSLITHEPVGDPTVYKFKGNANSGQLALTGARAPTDPGQLILLTALQAKEGYPMRLALADAAETVLYFMGQVMSYTTNVGSVNQITSFDTSVEISGKFITAVAP